MVFKISVTDECIGCGQCVSICDNFEINDDNKSVPKKKEVDEEGCNKAAAEACPVSAIVVKEA